MATRAPSLPSLSSLLPLLQSATYQLLRVLHQHASYPVSQSLALLTYPSPSRQPASQSISNSASPTDPSSFAQTPSQSATSPLHHLVNHPVQTSHPASFSLLPHPPSHSATSLLPYILFTEPTSHPRSHIFATIFPFSQPPCQSCSLLPFSPVSQSVSQAFSPSLLPFLPPSLHPSRSLSLQFTYTTRLNARG